MKIQDSLITIALYIANLILGMIAVKQLWFWFIVPFGLMELSYVHAYGIDLFITYLTTKASDFDKGKNENMYRERAIASLFITIIFLSFGYVASLFM